ncbi:Glycosyltransferase AER61 [Macleaya cordata]|uniref:Glycosyltransferase AER61 n=1 Tax=Macleaya cordata TaxID=56857 RepID=A0A200QSG3_MACCD|nr:Glycosyltransferase AER61 [Macleaya cordata]
MPQLAELLQAIGPAPPLLNNEADTFSWSLTPKGNFTVQSLYEHLSAHILLNFQIAISTKFNKDQSRVILEYSPNLQDQWVSQQPLALVVGISPYNMEALDSKFLDCGKPSKLKTSLWKVDLTLPQQPSKSSAPPPTQLISCDRTHERYDVCSIHGPTTMDPTKSTFYLFDPTTPSDHHQKQKIRPYPRKWETNIMSSLIKELTLITSPSKIHCQIQHQAPALVFSSGGYIGNLFHDFDDGFIPLFVTVRSIFPNGVHPILVISKCHHWWISKYTELLQRFTPYPIINLDNETSTHCFPSTTIGLISHGYMTINPKLLPNSETFRDFRVLLGTAYAKTSHLQTGGPITRPRLVLVSRTGDRVGRVMVNEAEVVLLAKEVGFEVIIFEPNQFTWLSEAYGLINRSHAMVGVHGAALTHSLFLRPGSVFIQIVPIGIDWLAETYFGQPTREMGLEYMEYKIEVNESSLVEKYGKDNLVLTNPKAVTKRVWSNTKNIYLKDQDVRVDLVRFGSYLRKAFKKAKRFMDKEG